MSFEQLIEEVKKNPGVAKQKMKVKLIKSGGFKAEVKAGRYKLVFDEDKAIGGTGEGPAPSQMLLASIGGCLLSTLNVWSRILKTPVKSAEVSVKGTIDGTKLLGIDENVPAGFQDLTVEFKIDSDESDEKIKELINAVEKHCPVHNTVVNASNVNIKINFQD